MGSSLEILIIPPVTGLGLVQALLNFIASISLPQISYATSISLSITSHFLMWFFCIIHMKYVLDGYISLVYICLTVFALLISLLVNDFILYETVLLKVMLDLSGSFGWYTCSHYKFIQIYIFGSPDSSLCMEKVSSFLLYVTI